jgi:hypothetical protein
VEAASDTHGVVAVRTTSFEFGRPVYDSGSRLSAHGYNSATARDRRYIVASEGQPTAYSGVNTCPENKQVLIKSIFTLGVLKLPR